MAPRLWKVGAANLNDAMQDAIPYLLVTVTNDADGTGSVTIQVKDAAGNNLAVPVLIHTWIAEADLAVPEAQTDFSVVDGIEWEEITANADYTVLTVGEAVMNIETDVAPDGSLPIFVMAEIGGRIYSGTKTITNPA